MKKIILLVSFFAVLTATAQNVGIGTPTPLARLHVTDSSVLFSATGEVPIIQGNPPISGEGRRMMWYADKAAFRAGYVETTQWNKSNIGEISIGLGYNVTASGFNSTALGTSTIASGSTSTAMGVFTIASGIYSTAMGYVSTASGDFSTAMGVSTTASGNISTASGLSSVASGSFSTAMGVGTTASGSASTAMGNLTTASGGSSTAIGDHLTASGNISTAMGYVSTAAGDYSSVFGSFITANSWASTSLGRYNDPIVTSPTTTWVGTEPLLIVGNGTGDGVNRSNALMLLKNGNMGIGSNNPTATIEIARGTGVLGTAAFHGTTHISHFNYSTTEDTYIRAGKDNRYVILNDIPGGKVGIGINTPNAPLAFANNTGQKISLYESGLNSQYGFAVQPFQLQIYSDNVAAKISFGYYSSGTFTERMFLNNSTGVLTVAGINYPSDARLKKDIIPLQNSLQKITQLNGYTYHWRNEQSGNDLQTGVLAQEVQKLFPQLVAEDKEGTLSVNYSGLIPVLIESVKEQQKQIDELKKLVQQLINK